LALKTGCDRCSARDRRWDGGENDEPPLHGCHRKATEERDEQLDELSYLPAHEVLDEHWVTGHLTGDLAGADVLVEGHLQP
jgi:hypothetical protein